MREFLYHTTIELITPLGNTYTLENYHASITEDIEAKVKTIDLESKLIDDTNIDEFTVGAEIKVYTAPKNEEKAHIGTYFVTDNPRQKEGIERTYQFNGTCFLGKTQFQIVNEFYDNWYIHEIIAHLIFNYAPWLSVGFIQETEHRMTIAFQDRYLYDCLNEISDVFNGIFEVDKDKVFYFEHKTNKRNNLPITSNNFKKGSADFALSMDKFANRLVLYGGNALSEKNHHDYFTGDGKNTTFALTYKPRTALSGSIEVYKNGIPLHVGTMNLHQFENGFDVLINRAEKNINFALPLHESEEIEVIYRYEYPLKTIMEHTNSIQEFGLFEQILEFKDITDLIALRERGQQHLEKYGLSPLFIGSIQPFYNDWDMGEHVLVNIPELGINHDLQITSKQMVLAPNIMEVSLQFEQKVRTREILKDILLKLNALRRTNEDIRIEKYEAIFSHLQVMENITIQAVDKFIVEKSKLE